MRMKADRLIKPVLNKVLTLGNYNFVRKKQSFVFGPALTALSKPLRFVKFIVLNIKMSIAAAFYVPQARHCWHKEKAEYPTNQPTDSLFVIWKRGSSASKAQRRSFYICAPAHCIAQITSFNYNPIQWQR